MKKQGINLGQSVNQKENIGVLTYDIPHKKTFDTLCLLKAKGYRNVTVYASPLHYTKKFHPYIIHRPEITAGIPDTKEICKNFDYEYREGDIGAHQTNHKMIYLVCGTGILPEEFVKKNRVINSHPGYIPLARGLDAFKWSVYKNLPIGVTTHIIGEYIDAGEVIERRIVNIYEYDTFHLVAQRVYDNEIDMLVGALELIHNEHCYIEPGDSIVHRRMPHEKELELYDRFEKMKAGLQDRLLAD